MRTLSLTSHMITSIILLDIPFAAWAALCRILDQLLASIVLGFLKLAISSAECVSANICIARRIRVFTCNRIPHTFLPCAIELDAEYSD